MTRTLRTVLPVAALAVLVLIAGEASACPNCKATVAETKDGSAAAFGFSIYLMVGSVLGIAGALTFKIVRAVRRADALSA